MNYYQLTDPLRFGQIIQEDGRKHYRFVFGTYRWERTTLFQEYLTAGTPCGGRYRPVSEEQAQALLAERGRHLIKLLQKADAIAEAACSGKTDRAGEPRIERVRAVANALDDWEERLTALLSEACSGGWTVEMLRERNVPPTVCLAVELLQRKDGVPCGTYLQRLRQNRLARNVKLMDLSWSMELHRIACPTDHDRAQAEACKRARQYLYGDIPEFTGELD